MNNYTRDGWAEEKILLVDIKESIYKIEMVK